LPYQFTPLLHLSSFFLFVHSVVVQTSVPDLISLPFFIVRPQIIGTLSSF
jgi:hypothetical protein